MTYSQSCNSHDVRLTMENHQSANSESYSLAQPRTDATCTWSPSWKQRETVQTSIKLLKQKKLPRPASNVAMVSQICLES